jgi:hypothetical protein
MANKKTDQTVHIRLDNSINKRRMVLQSAIDVIALLKRYENIKNLSKQKHEAYDEFRKVISSINWMVRQIRVKDLPLNADDLSEYTPKPVKEKTAVQKVVRKVKKAIQAKVPEERKDSLDWQMQELRRKLNSL